MVRRLQPCRRPGIVRARIGNQERHDIMGGWRTHESQHSDRQPIKRSKDEKQRLLQRLKDDLAATKPTAAAALRQALAKRIAELEAELASGR